MDKSLQDIKEKLREIEEQIKDLRSKERELKDDAVKFCRVAIGDVVEVNEWSHEGRLIKVDQIQFARNQRYLAIATDFVCSGYLIKKDGSLGVRRGKHYC